MTRRLLFSLVAFSLAVVTACDRGEPEGEPDSGPADAGTAALTAAPAGGGDVRIVRLVARGDAYAFEPAELQLRAGAVVRFVQTGFQPDAIAFDAAAAAPEAADFLLAHDLLHGPLLTEPGVFFDVDLRDAPPGEYRFHSVPHREHGMTGRVVIEP